MIFKRNVQGQLEKWLFKDKVLILYGARQVGKTTLVKTLIEKYSDKSAYFDCEIISVRQALETKDLDKLKQFVGDHKLIVLDEAQKVDGIGVVLKLFSDHYPKVQVVATGSSSFDLANKVNEPLTGRALEFVLMPLSMEELGQAYKVVDLSNQVEQRLRFGMYPEIVQQSEAQAKILLDNLSSKYLYQDILEFDRVRKSEMLLKLLQMLALQIGNEVSYFELARALEVDRSTVIKYIDLLEKTFVITKLRAFSRNLRKEINKKNKIFFYDLGVLNSLIANYNPMTIRNDVGGLWENFCVVERLKYLQSKGEVVNRYFWRTHDKKEIDYIEESGGVLRGFEFKWGKGKLKPVKEFLSTYKGSSIELVSRNNFMEKFLCF